MSKIGVGVGDEFPVDDGANPNQTNPNTPSTPQDDRAAFEDWKRRRDAWRAQQQARHDAREAWRAQREAMKQEWRKRRHEWRAQAHQWRDDVRGEFDGSGRGYGPGDYGHGQRWHGGWHRHGGAKLLGMVAILALAIFAITHIGTILMGLAAIAVLVIAWHHFGPGGHDFDRYRYRHAGPTAAPTTPPAAPQASADTTPKTDQGN